MSLLLASVIAAQNLSPEQSSFVPLNEGIKSNRKTKKTKEDIPDPFNGNKVYGYAYSASPTETGGTGLFTVFDAYGIHKGEFRISASVTRFSRDPSLRITQVPLSFTYGARNWLEVFFSTIPYQRVGVNAPEKLSGTLLFSALSGSNQATNVFTSNVNKGFFLLPGLPVTGATVGGVLPGIPVGQAAAQFDPILNRNKNAFITPRYFNDLPFTGRSGSGYSDTTIGAKARLLPIGFGDALVGQVSALGYVKIPSQRANGLTNAGNNLYKGTGSGTVDVGGFLLYSTYLPYCNFTKQKCSPNVLAEPSGTLNTHINLGFIYNGNPKIDGLRALDRRNAFVSSLGVDGLVSRFAQALGEFKYSRYIGGGTPNFRTTNPADITLGFKFFPLGMPKENPTTTSKDYRFFLSFGVAYRYSFNIAELSGLVKNNHGFVFQLSTGRSNGTEKLTIGSKKSSNCNDSTSQNPFQIIDLKLDSSTANKGQEIVAIADVSRPTKAELTYSLKLAKNGSVVKSISFPVTSESLKFVSKPAIPFRADFDAGVYQIQWVANYTFGGVPCQEVIKAVDLTVLDTPRPFPTLNLVQSWQNPISARTAQNLVVDAQLENSAPDQLTWKTNPEVSISGINLRRTIDSTVLQAGETYTIMAEIPNLNGDPINRQVQVVVNNPPTVTLNAKGQSLTTFDVEQGTPLELLAAGKDKDNQQLEYIWDISAATYDGKPISLSSNFLDSIGSDTEKPISTEQLAFGDYTVSVITDDSLDKSEASALSFRVVPRTKNIKFAFDIPKRNKPLSLGLDKKAKEILDEEVNWLLQSPNRSVEIRCEGNTDNIGGEQYNFELGCRRVCAARDYLITRLAKQQSPSDKPAGERVRVMISFGKIKADLIEQRDEDRRVDLIYTRINGVTSAVPSDARLCDCSITTIKKLKKYRKKRNK